MANTYTVKKGDTLSELAVKFNTTVSELVRLNKIKNPDLILIGQVLRLNDSAPSNNTKSSSSRAVIDLFGIQSKTERTFYASWIWNESYVKHYEVMWYYSTGDGIWFIGNDSTTEYKQSVYTPPDNATKVKFKVRPISTTYIDKTTKKEVNHWSANWSTEKVYNVPITLKVPPVPNVTIKNYKLTATIENIDVDGNRIEFYVCKDNKTLFASAVVTIPVDNYVTYSCNILAGAEYKVRCRSIKGDLYSEWSDYSGNELTAPRASEEIIAIKALSATEVQLDWENVPNTETYEIEYTTQKRYFDSSDQTTTKTVDATAAGHAEITGLESGQTYYFRVRACNSAGKSGWTEIKTITIGKKPTAPTTWSSATTAIVGEQVKLYWVHNTEDGSSQTYAQLEITINGNTTVKEVKNSTDEEEKDKTSVYTVDTSSYTEGTVLKWRVKTKGITDEYSDWSTQRTIDVYAPPTLELFINDVEGEPIEQLYSFPFYVEGIPGPNTQEPIGYHVTVIANESYETIDQLGNSRNIKEGEVIYSKNFNTDENLLIELSAGNINLENNISYTVNCVASMNSGLTAENSRSFTVAWADDIEDIYEPNAAIGYDPNRFTMSINPYCEDANKKLVENVVLSVYRMEYDGTFTEIATEIENSKSIFVTDPHPSLSYARYRIVVKSTLNGRVGYFDMPGYYVGEKAILIQWSEDWKDLNLTGEDPLYERVWSGSLIRLPYNIDISYNNKPDVSFIEYIGRENPVSYYGTQLGVTTTWNVEIPADDEETLYALRRLAKWMGDVYVREPSGLGYWANVQLSFNTKHKAVTIPVSFSVTKVEGGM